MENNTIEGRVWNSIFKKMSEDSVSELTVNGPDSFFVTRSGVRERLDVTRMNSKEYYKSIELGLAPFIRSSMSFKDAQHIFEGSILVPEFNIRGRATIVLPPSSPEPSIVITKRSSSLRELSSIAYSGSMSSEMYDFIEAAVKSNCTIVVSGGTGSGKTTMTEAIIGLMDKNARIGVAEDVPELQLPQENVTYLNSTPRYPGMVPGSEPDLQWLVEQFQRLRLDKIVIGETRGKEFADFLVAANSGLEGSITTIHSNDPRGCLEKMSRFAQRGAPEQPTRMINREIGSTIDIIIQLKKFKDGRYRTTHIEHVPGTVGKGEDAALSSSTLYRYDQESDSFVKSSPIPDEIREKFSEHGVEVGRFTSNPVNRKEESYNYGFLSRAEELRKPPRSNPLRRG